jgi:hypothetical protein
MNVTLHSAVICREFEEAVTYANRREVCVFCQLSAFCLWQENFGWCTPFYLF